MLVKHFPQNSSELKNWEKGYDMCDERKRKNEERKEQIIWKSENLSEEQRTSSNEEKIQEIEWETNRNENRKELIKFWYAEINRKAFFWRKLMLNGKFKVNK